VPARGRGSQLHQHTDGGRCRIPHGHVFRVQDRKPALGIEVGLVDDAGEAVGERRDDAVRSSGHPARISRTPEHVVRMKVEGEAGSRMMRDDGLVDVQGALGFACRPAGEMEQRRIFRIGGRDGHARVGRVHQLAKVSHPRQLPNRRRVADEQDVFEAWERRSERFDLLPIQRVGGDEDLRACDADPRLNRLGAEGGEERREDAAVLQRAERGDVELWNPAGEHRDGVPLADTERAQDLGEAAGLVAEIAVREVATGALPGNPPQRHAVPPGPSRVAVDRFMSDIQSPALGEPVERLASRGPGKFRTRPLVVQQIGHDRPIVRRLVERRPTSTKRRTC